MTFRSFTKNLPHSPLRGRPPEQSGDGPTVKLKKIKATVLKSTGQLPRMREKLHELKLVAVYDARRVRYRDKCMRKHHTLPG